MKENYTPQFDFDNIPEQKHEIKKCKGCGKTGEYLGLDKNGLCFYCRDKGKKDLNLNMKLSPNWEKFNEYYSNKRNQNNDGNSDEPVKSLMLFYAFGAFYSFSMWLYCLIVLLIVLLVLSLSAIASSYLESPVPAIVIIIISIIATIIFCSTSEKRRKKKFDKYNNMKIEISDNEWVCPCCKNSNIGKGHCDRCGVLPKFK